MTVRFQTLGPLRLRQDGTEIPAGRPQQQAVLAALLAARGRPLTTTQLLHAVWGEDDEHWPSHPKRALATHIYRIRQLPGFSADFTPDLSPDFTPGLSSGLSSGFSPGGACAALLQAGEGYRLSVEAGAVDMHRFDDAVQAAAAARRKGDPDGAHALLTQGLALWYGTALDGVPGPLAERIRQRLAASRTAALEARLSIDMARGRHAEVLPEIAALAEDPDASGQVLALLVLALFRSGRRDEACAVYDRARDRAQELGLDPAPELERAHREILGSPAVQARSGPHGPVRPCHLPPDIGDFTGRTTETALLQEALTPDGTAVRRPVVIHGAAGTGKTTLAVHVAHQLRDLYPDGQLYAALTGSDALPGLPGRVLAAFIRALGEDVPGDEAAMTAAYQAALDGRRVMVVLDDVRDLDAVRPLIPRQPGCAAVVTGRALTGLLPDAQWLALGAFSPEDALGLLVRTLGASRVEAEPDAARALAEACRCHPALLRATAARLAARPHWSVASMVDRVTE
ncbi:BTAD domain-containing putative transcriptional regulator [Streptomyces sp. VNUA116]|uniref:AfsR/SARP family transcriptional regulator n=1 Tax=Streptomyces sp. VNUA116 TaxID=3062449 RepID=UPI0026761782|nr:BTAD domain-containing putative transcriptional regulator [Streptomyces sp. VNUA116]WKU49019.1 BTAD domain-containing putative transcriptional regulator [Streptomyces sp. VNUA116]